MLNSDRSKSQAQNDSAEQASQELAANKAGRLTDDQQKRIARIVGDPYNAGLIVVGLLLALACLCTPTFLFTKVAPGPLVAAVLGYIVLLLLIAGALFWRRAVLLHEVKAGPIEHATGQIILQGRDLVAQIPSRKLALGGDAYRPGDYVFYFLPRYGRVLSAELAPSDPRYGGQPAPAGPMFTPSEPQQPAMTDDQLLQALAKTNGFSMNDLANFRQGRLGAAAQRQLSGGCLGYVLLLLVVGAILAGFILVGGEAIIHNISRVPLYTTLAVLFVAALLVAPFGWLTWAMSRGVLRTALDLLSDKVATVEGEVVKRMGTRQVSGGRSGGSYSAYYYYYQMADQQLAHVRLNDHEWVVSNAAYYALDDRRKYRLYYLPRSMNLMGIEPLRE